jgi:hypothetical protein
MGDNPFGGGAGASSGTQSTALTLGNQAQAVGRMVDLPNGTQIRVSSDADFQLLQAWWQQLQQQQRSSNLTLGGIVGNSSMGSIGNTGGTTRALEMAADGAQALSGFLAGRDLSAKIRDYDDAQEEIDRLRDELSRTATITGAQLARFIQLQQELNDTQVAVLETQISAVDIQAGAGLARIVGKFMDGSGSGMGGGGGAGTAIALGAAGVGGALILSRDSRDRRRRR